MAGVTVQVLAEKQASTDLAVQQVQSDVRNHIEGCVEGQRRVEARFDDMDDRFDNLDKSIKVISDAQIASAAAATATATTTANATAAALVNARPKWWVTLLVSLVGGAVVATFGWMGATIWNMQNARVDQALRAERPAAQVTVNPAQTPAPIMQQPAPVPPLDQNAAPP